MPAGFLITRLLLVCLLSEVEYNSIFATAQPPASQGARSTYDYLPNLPLQHIQHQRLRQDAHNNLWAKIMEGFTKNRPYPEANHQLSLLEQIQNPYQHLPQIRIRYPSDLVSSQNPALESKKIEFNVNVPVQHILKTLALTKKGPEWFRDFREGDFSHRVNPVSYQEGPFWSEHKNLPRDTVKRKRTQGGGNPGLNFRFSAPIPGHRDRRLSHQRPENLAYLFSQSGLAKQSSPEFGLEKPIMHHGLGLHHPCFSQMTPSGCPLVNQGQVNPNTQQLAQQEEKKVQQQTPQQQLPILSQILTAGHNSLSAGNLWTEEFAKRLPQFHLSIGNAHPGPGDQQKKQVKAPEQKKPQSSEVYPRLGCSYPEVQNSQGEQWVLCPRLFRGWRH